MMMKRLYMLTILLASLTAMAQVKVEMSLEPMELLVGEQSAITLSVTAKEGQQVQFPDYQYTAPLIPGVEVLEMKDLDTIRLDDQRVRLTRIYTITSFDDSLYYLQPMEVKVDGKTYKASGRFGLKVLTIEVDTVHPNQFFPPKGVQNNPFLWSEWAPFFWLALLVLLLIAGVTYLYMRLRDNKPVITRIRFVRHVPPHQKAMMQISKIKGEHVDIGGDQKEYYTRLTDTLRVYLEERFGIKAMEMTTGEIMERLRQEEDQSKINELRDLLETADLVKFAKHTALLNERDRNMASVVEFIEATKSDETATVERVQSTLSDSERRSQRSRHVLIALITVMSLLAVGLFGYVVWNVFSMMAF